MNYHKKYSFLVFHLHSSPPHLLPLHFHMNYNYKRGDLLLFFGSYFCKQSSLSTPRGYIVWTCETSITNTKTLLGKIFFKGIQICDIIRADNISLLKRSSSQSNFMKTVFFPLFFFKVLKSNLKTFSSLLTSFSMTLSSGAVAKNVPNMIANNSKIYEKKLWLFYTKIKTDLKKKTIWTPEGWENAFKSLLKTGWILTDLFLLQNATFFTEFLTKA